MDRSSCGLGHWHHLANRVADIRSGERISKNLRQLSVSVTFSKQSPTHNKYVHSFKTHTCCLQSPIKMSPPFACGATLFHIATVVLLLFENHISALGPLQEFYHLHRLVMTSSASFNWLANAFVLVTRRSWLSV